MLNIIRYLAKALFALTLSAIVSTGILYAGDVDYKELNPFTGNLDATRSDSSIVALGDTYYLRTDCTNDPLTAPLDLPEVYNSLGNLKIMPDCQGNVDLFGDTDVDDDSVGKIFSISRRAVEGDTTLSIFGASDRAMQIQSNWDLDISSSTASGEIRLGTVATNVVRLVGAINTIGYGTGTDNFPLRHYGYISAGGLSGEKYVSWLVDDTDDYFTLTRQTDLILGLKISMPVIGYNFTSSVAIGTSPYACTSTTLNTNLNADLLDGHHSSELLLLDQTTPQTITASPVLDWLSASQALMTDADKKLISVDYLDQAVKTTSSPTFAGLTSTGNIEISKADPEIRLTDTDDSNYTRWTRTDTSGEMKLRNIVYKPGSDGYSFTNTADEGHWVSNTLALTANAAFCMWVNLTSLGNDRGIICSNSITPLNLRTNSSGVIYLYITFSDATNTGYINCGTLTAAKHLLAVSFDGTTLQVWVDNASVYSANTWAGKSLSTSAGYVFGYLTGNPNTKRSRGSIDQCHIFNRGITNTEVTTTLWNGGSGLDTNDPLGDGSCVHNYKWNEGSGTSSVDSVGTDDLSAVNTPSWGTGLVVIPGSDEESTIISSKDGTAGLENGINTFGDSSSRTVLDGLTLRFNIGGVEYGQLDSTGSLNWTGDVSFDGGTFNYNPSMADLDAIFYGDTGEVFRVDAGNNRLDVTSTSIFKDKIILTQTDGNEYIDSLADGYTDVMATTGVRQTAPSAAPTLSQNSTVSFYIDEVGGNLKVVAKYSDGTSKTATIAFD